MSVDITADLHRSLPDWRSDVREFRVHRIPETTDRLAVLKQWKAIARFTGRLARGEDVRMPGVPARLVP